MSDVIGALSGHMALHILAMNFVAPAIALAWRSGAGCGGKALLVAAAVQMVLLWAWHVPSVLALGMDAPFLGIALHLILFVSAFMFWRTVIDAAAASPWLSIAALLVTGKLVCLLGILLAFAQRPIYAPGHGAGHEAMLLADQQTAGLMMLIACPLTYVLGAVVVSARWLASVEHGPDAEKLLQAR